MSDMPEHEAIREPVEEWTGLYIYAREQRKALRAPLPKAVLAAVIMASILLVAGGLGGGAYRLNTYFSQVDATRQAEATRRAIFLDITATAQAIAQAATATADSLALDRRAQAQGTAQAAMATQQAIDLQGTAIALATAQAAIATQQAIDLQATAVAQGCAASDRYSLSVGEPILFPKPGKTYVIGNPPFALRATWVVTNTGQCAWEEVRLRPLGGGEPISVPKGERVEPGQVVEIDVTFAFSGAHDVAEVRDVEGEWILMVRNPLGGDHVLFEQPHLRLKVEGWVIAVTPTPTPTYTATPTGTSTPTSPPAPTEKPPKPPPTDTPKPPSARPTDTPKPPPVRSTDTPRPTPESPTDTPKPSP